MKLKIIYEDRDVIVIDKPAGIAVHPAKSNWRSDRGANPKDKHDTLATIVSKVSKHYPLIKNVGENPLRPGVVHRLDKETSGLMVVAKNNEAFHELKKQFQERRVEKRYIGLVSGVLEKDKGIIETSLSKNGTKSYAKGGLTPTRGSDPHDTASTIKNKTKEAITEYKVLKRYNEYTLVEVSPKTGRMHQIRVHFASINHPIACDKLYGRKAKKCPTGLSRHFLHASYLKFRIKNALMEFDVDLPDDLAKTISNLK